MTPSDFFSPEGFMPHGHCYLWRPDLLLLHGVSDALVALAYFSIPVLLLFFVRRRKDLPFPGVFLLTGIFIVSCGMTHVLEVVTLWVPVYWLAGGVKSVTAASSLLTAVALVRVIPKALALPSPDDLRHARDASDRSEARFRAFLTGSVDVFIFAEAVRDEKGQIVDFLIVDANPAADEWVGVPPGTLVGRLRSSLPLSSRHSGEEELVRVVETGVPFEEERSTDEEEPRWIRRRVVRVGDGVAHTLHDITIEREHHDLLELQEAIVRGMAEGIAVVRAADRRIVFANPKLERLLGYERGKLEGRSFDDIVRPDDRDPLPDFPVSAYVRDHGETALDADDVRKDGRRVPVHVSVSSFEHRDFGRVWVTVHDDMTIRRSAEEAKARLASIVEHTPDAIIGKSADDLVETWNGGAERLFGWTAHEAVGRPIDLIVPDDQMPEERARMARIRAGEALPAFESVRTRRDGTRLDVWVAAAAIHDARGAIVGVSTITRDVTDRNRHERELDASIHEKEILLKEVHHRVKNNLQLVSSLLNLQMRRVSDPAVHALFVESQSRVQSIALLHEKLYTTSEVSSVALDGYFQDLVRANGDGSDASWEVDADGIVLPLDEAVPCALIVNELVTNAFKHAWANDSAAPDTAKRLRLSARREGDRVTLVVHDNGRGAQTGLAKPDAETLGMHLVRALAKQLRGELSFANDGGTKATFSFSSSGRPPTSTSGPREAAP